MSKNDTVITMSYKSEMQFTAENSTGCKIHLEPLAFMGGNKVKKGPAEPFI
jgi:hypothetical protein